MSNTMIFRHIYQVWDIVWYIQFHQFQFWGHFHSVRFSGVVCLKVLGQSVGMALLVWALGFGVRVAGLGISWMQMYSLLSSTDSSFYMRSSSSDIWRPSSSSSESAANAGSGVSSKDSHWHTPSLNGRPLGYLGVKDKSWVWGVV